MALVRLSGEERTGIEAALASNLDTSVVPPVRLARIEREALIRRLAAGYYEDGATLVGPLTADDVTPDAGQVVTFDCDVLVPDPHTYEFRKGDGSESQTSAPPWTHAYEDGGEYTASLVVKFEDQREAVRVLDVTVADTVPVLGALVADPESGVVPLTVEFTCENTGGPEESWVFDPGDGGDLLQAPPPWRHTYMAAGTFTPDATAVNEAGSDQATGAVEATAPAPEIVATCAPSQGIAPLYVTIRGQVTNGEAVTAWTMDPGDGGAVQGPGTPSSWLHTYQPGTFTITVTAEGPNGTDTAETQVVVVL